MIGHGDIDGTYVRDESLAPYWPGLIGHWMTHDESYHLLFIWFVYFPGIKNYKVIIKVLISNNLFTPPFAYIVNHIKCR